MPREYERFPRPSEPYYESRFPYLSQGDLFADVPFAITGPEIRYAEDVPGLILQPVVFQRGMVLSPTCDFRRPSAAMLQGDPTMEPYTLQDHVMVAPVFPLRAVAERWGPNASNNTHLARQYDALRRYMYLPPLLGEDEAQECLVDLSRTDTVAIHLLASQIRRTPHPANLCRCPTIAVQSGDGSDGCHH